MRGSGGVLNNELVVRVGSDRYEDALAEPHARPMDFMGRPVKSFVYVRSQGLRDREALKRWIDHGVRYAMPLPVKRSWRASRRTPVRWWGVASDDGAR